MIAQGVDELGYGGEPASRFGIVYEADWGGSESGCYVVVDRVQGFRSAWRMRVERNDGARKTQERLDRLRELVAGENERWREKGEVCRAVVKGGGRDKWGLWRSDAERGA